MSSAGEMPRKGSRFSNGIVATCAAVMARRVCRLGATGARTPMRARYVWRSRDSFELASCMDCFRYCESHWVPGSAAKSRGGPGMTTKIGDFALSLRDQYTWRQFAQSVRGTSELALQEVHGRGVGLHPRSVAQEAVDFVGDHHFLEGHAVLPEARHYVFHLEEMHVVVVVALDQQHGRFPFRDVGVGRGIPRHLQRLLVVALFVARVRFAEPLGDVARPVVQAVHVHA